MPLIAQMPPFRMEPEHFAVFALVTGGFLIMAWLLGKRTRSTGSHLILMGILVMILSLGYGLVSVPTFIVLTPGLNKIGFLLVLGGVGCSLLASCPMTNACSTTTANKEADHV